MVIPISGLELTSLLLLIDKNQMNGMQNDFTPHVVFTVPTFNPIVQTFINDQLIN